MPLVTHCEDLCGLGFSGKKGDQLGMTITVQSSRTIGSFVKAPLVGRALARDAEVTLGGNNVITLP